MPCCAVDGRGEAGVVSGACCVFWSKGGGRGEGRMDE